MTAATNGEHERVIAAIRQKYLVAFVKGQGVESTSLILTQTKIYGYGQSYSAAGSSSRIRFVGDVSQLSSVGLEYRSNFVLLILAILSSVVFVLQFGGSGRTDGDGAFLAALLFFVFYALSRRKMLIINLGGYAHALSVSGVPEQEVIEFMNSAMVWLTERSRYLTGAQELATVQERNQQ